MVRAFVCSFVVLSIVGPQTGKPADLRIASIQVKGNQRYTAEEVTRLSGLEIGRSARPEDLTAAASRMAATGLFDAVRYTYTTGRDMSVIFEITEPAWTVPVILDNFVSLPDDQLIVALRADVPSFDGTAPNTGGAPDFIAQALQNVLKRHGVPGRVEFTPQVDMVRNQMSYLFAVKDPAPKVCAVRVAGAAAIPERDLVAPLQGIVGGDYSRFFVSAAARGTLTDMYRRKGLWRAEFAIPQIAVDAGCPGVSVTLPVNEDRIYTWDRAEWSGHRALSADALDKALAMKPGEVADAGKIEAGIRAVRKLYGSQGYVGQKAALEPKPDAASGRAVFAIRIEEGPQYRMGTLTFEGIRDADAAMLHKKWKLKSGDVYDEDYEARYLREEIFPLQTSAGGRGSLATRVDPAAQTVDVKIVFK